MSPKVERSGPRSLVGESYLELEECGAYSFCPDSNDASTPAKQVHLHLRMRDYRGGLSPRYTVRFLGPDTLDALIEALMEHRTYVFGQHAWRQDWPVQPHGPQPGRRSR